MSCLAEMSPSRCHLLLGQWRERFSYHNDYSEEQVKKRTSEQVFYLREQSLNCQKSENPERQ